MTCKLHVLLSPSTARVYICYYYSYIQICRLQLFHRITSFSYFSFILFFRTSLGWIIKARSYHCQKEPTSSCILSVRNQQLYFVYLKYYVHNKNFWKERMTSAFLQMLQEDYHDLQISRHTILWYISVHDLHQFTFWPHNWQTELAHRPRCHFWFRLITKMCTKHNIHATIHTSFQSNKNLHECQCRNKRYRCP